MENFAAKIPEQFSTGHSSLIVKFSSCKAYFSRIYGKKCIKVNWWFRKWNQNVSISVVNIDTEILRYKQIVVNSNATLEIISVISYSHD